MGNLEMEISDAEKTTVVFSTQNRYDKIMEMVFWSLRKCFLKALSKKGSVWTIGIIGSRHKMSFG